VVTAVGASGPTITSAGLVLAGTFLVLAVTGGSGSGGSQIRDIGLGLALGILMDTFLVRSLLVPSTVSLLGRWNWWPGKLAEMDQIGGAGPPSEEDAVEGLSPAVAGPVIAGRGAQPR
jgi:RND superfamily putative drug exporter